MTLKANSVLGNWPEGRTGLKIWVILVWAVPENWMQRWRDLFPPKIS